MSTFLIEQESKQKWMQNIPNTNNSVFALEWLTDVDTNAFYCIGLDTSTRKLAKFKTSLENGLFVWAKNKQIIISLTRHLNKFIDTKKEIKVISSVKYSINQTTLLDKILDNGRTDENWVLFKIPTYSFSASKQLHSILSALPSISYHIATLGVWSIECFILIELHIKHSLKNIPIYCISINKFLEYDHTYKINPFNVFVLDIETVSHQDHRLPMGNEKTDIIMSIAIVRQIPEKNILDIHTIFNLPLTDDVELLKAEALISNQKEAYKYITHRTCSVVNSEELLLRKTFALLAYDDTYICLGYNSKSYDLVFLLSRALYLNMPECVNFFYKNGIISYGQFMIHIDMYQVIAKYYANELTNFSLKNVTKILLDDVQKVDFDARNLRYIYSAIEKNKSIGDGVFSNDSKSFIKWSIDLQSMAHYNDIDSVAVLALWHELQYNDFLIYVSRNYMLTLPRIAQTGVSEYLNTNIIYEGLIRKVVCTSHHNTQLSYNKDICVTTNLNQLASSTKYESSGYGGGLNFRNKKEHIKKVVAMDALAYYPQLIAGCNLSHETTLLFTIGGIRNILKIMKNSTEIFKNCEIYRFCTHKNISDTKNIDNIELLDNLSSRLYIFNYNDNGSRIDINTLDKYSDDERILIIDKANIGFLSSIITHRNIIRNIAKATKKKLQNILNSCQELLPTFEISNNQVSNFDDQEIDFDDQEIDFDDQEIEDEPKKFNINDYKILKDANLSEDLYMVQPHYKLLQKQDFLKMANKLEALNIYIEHIKHDCTRVLCLYRNMKIINSSIYGLLGSSYGILKGKNIAAAATMLGRLYIIEAAKCGHNINCDVVYIDTDSVFITTQNSTHATPIQYIQKTVNALNSSIILNYKIYSDIFIMAKKKYIASSDGIFSRGINKHGPTLWNYQIYNFYTKYICNEQNLLSSDVYNVLLDMYEQTYDMLKDDKTKVLCSMHIKNRDEYKTQTPAKKLLDRINLEVPNHVFSGKITYFHLLKNSPNNTEFGLDFELPITNIYKLNLYKFYSHIIKTIFDIISYSIYRTNKRRSIYIKYSNSEFKKINLLAFVTASSKI